MYAWVWSTSLRRFANHFDFLLQREVKYWFSDQAVFQYLLLKDLSGLHSEFLREGVGVKVEINHYAFSSYFEALLSFFSAPFSLIFYDGE